MSVKSSKQYHVYHTDSGSKNTWKASELSNGNYFIEQRFGSDNQYYSNFTFQADKDRAIFEWQDLRGSGKKIIPVEILFDLYEILPILQSISKHTMWERTDIHSTTPIVSLP